MRVAEALHKRFGTLPGRWVLQSAVVSRAARGADLLLCYFTSPTLSGADSHFIIALAAPLVGFLLLHLREVRCRCMRVIT